MTNGDAIKAILKPRTDQIRIYGDWVEIEIQSLAIYFSCELGWWEAECKEPITENCIACKYDETEEEDGEHCKKCLAGNSQFELDKEFVEPTTKNNLAQERYQDLIEYFDDEKVAKIILENRGQFKAWLERLRWHVKRADELARELEQIKGTTKNDLGVDCISREQAKVAIRDKFKDLPSRVEINTILNELPSVTPTSRESVDCIDRQATLDAIIKRLGIKNETYLLEAERAIYQQILAMPSVTPQLSSELAKNSKKLEKTRKGFWRVGLYIESANTDRNRNERFKIHYCKRTWWHGSSRME